MGIGSTSTKLVSSLSTRIGNHGRIRTRSRTPTRTRSFHDAYGFAFAISGPARRERQVDGHWEYEYRCAEYEARFESDRRDGSDRRKKVRPARSREARYPWRGPEVTVPGRTSAGLPKSILPTPLAAPSNWSGGSPRELYSFLKAKIMPDSSGTRIAARFGA